MAALTIGTILKFHSFHDEDILTFIVLRELGLYPIPAPNKGWALVRLLGSDIELKEFL